MKCTFCEKELAPNKLGKYCSIKCIQDQACWPCRQAMAIFDDLLKPGIKSDFHRLYRPAQMDLIKDRSKGESYEKLAERHKKKPGDVVALVERFIKDVNNALEEP